MNEYICEAVTPVTFYQRELYFMTAHTGEPKDVPTFPIMFPIEYRCRQVFLQSVQIFS
jgi:hypothetical protein